MADCPQNKEKKQDLQSFGSLEGVDRPNQLTAEAKYNFYHGGAAGVDEGYLRKVLKYQGDIFFK